MATRTSAMISQEQYLGSIRGRPIDHNMGWEMFPEKTEATPISEDPDQLYNDQRKTLMDYSPVQNSLFPYEQPMRDTYAKSHLNLRDGGVFGATTDPWANSGQNGGQGFDISFHDKDPRGWSTEQPWKNYRQLAEVQLQNIDFKDDSDNSIPSDGIHPNTMNNQIRAAQNWIKSRLKIFSEEWEGKQNGGVGVYPNVSKVYRSDWENSGVGTDDKAPSRTFDDPEVEQHHNINISNVVNLGSKFLRANTTTDNLVKVAAYNKLYQERGLINHETQLRILEDDTPWSSMEGKKISPRGLTKLMSQQIYADNPNISSYAASEIARILMQHDQLEKPIKNKEEFINNNRNLKLTQDIIALFGFSENDIKYLEEKQRKNSKQPLEVVTNLYDLVTTVHKMSYNEKLQMRNELILRSAGMGLSPSTSSELRKIQDTIVVNPKIIQFMEQQTKKNKSKDNDFSKNQDLAIKDPENKLNNILSKNSLFVYKSPSKATDMVMSSWNGHKSETDTKSKKTANYKNIAKYSKHLEKNTRQGVNAQLPGESIPTLEINQMLMGDTNYQDNLRKFALDNEFGENKSLNRHTGLIGSKQMRKYIISDYIGSDNMSEKSQNQRTLALKI